MPAETNASALDLRFLRRLVLAGLAATAILAAMVWAASPRWAGHFLFAGVWMAANWVILGALLWAMTSRPKQLALAFILMPLKLGWLALIWLYFLWLAPPPLAIVAGLIVPFAGAVAAGIAASRKHKGSG